MTDLLWRALFGGVFVSVFALMGDVIKPVSCSNLSSRPRTEPKGKG